MITKSNNMSRNVLFCAASVLSMGFGVSGASAQEVTQTAPAATQAEPPVSDLGDIVVTARRVNERLQDVPVAVSAVNAETLRQNNINSVEDLRTTIPSLQVAPSATGAGLPSIQIRGQAQSRSVIGQDPSVAVYVSDFANTIAIGLNQSLYDIDSVQVLRGPQGTLFGKNTTGGALLVTPARPSTTERTGWISGEITNYNGRRVQGALNVPLSDNFAFRIAGSRELRDGYVTNIVDGRDYYNEDNWSVRASLLFQTGRFENLTIIDKFSADTHNLVGISEYGRPGSPADMVFPGPGGFLDAVARQNGRDPTRVETGPVSFLTSSAWGVVNTSTFEINDNLTLKNVAGYREAKSSQILDLVGITVPVGLFDPTDDRAEWWSDELQLIGDYDRLKWIVGLYYYDEKGNNDAPFRALVTSPLSPLQLLGGSAHNTAYSAFAQGTYAFAGGLEGLSLTLGARYTVDERETTAYSRLVTPVPTCLVEDDNGVRLPANACARTESETFREPTYTISLDYKWSDSILTYVAHRRGYRTGGFNIRATRDAMFDPFQPEIVQDVEAGIKADWTLGSAPVRTNLAVYKQFYDDIQRNVNVILAENPRATGTNVINAASATIEGLEFDATIRPFPDLLVTASYAYTKPEYDTFVDDLGNDLSKNRFYLVPENSASVAATYTLPVDPDLGRVSATLSYFMQGDFAIADDNEGYLAPAYELWNARLDWKNVGGSTLDVSFFGQNLTDERYVTGGDSKVGALGYRSYFLGTPRIYGVQARYGF